MMTLTMMIAVLMVMMVAVLTMMLIHIRQVGQTLTLLDQFRPTLHMLKGFVLIKLIRHLIVYDI